MTGSEIHQSTYSQSGDIIYIHSGQDNIGDEVNMDGFPWPMFTPLFNLMSNTNAVVKCIVFLSNERGLE